MRPIKTKFGYFACSKRILKNIKILYGYYWQAVQMAAKWTRWHKKNPNNRVIKVTDNIDGKKIIKEIVQQPEPPLMPIFTNKETITSYYNSQGTYIQGGFQTEKVSICDMGIINLYDSMRKPKKYAKNLPELTFSNNELLTWIMQISNSKTK